MLQLSVLSSGSKGNCAVVQTEGATILVDAGISCRQICTRLETIGLSAESLDAIVITHEHGDHTKGLDVFCRKHELPVYATAHTAKMVDEKVAGQINWLRFDSSSSFEVLDLEVQAFPVPHDAVDPVGFVIAAQSGIRLGIVSDVGHVTHLMVDRLKDLDILFTESNYDEELLMNDTVRPWSTKQRIANRHGHLSNVQTAELIDRVASERLQHIILGHLSSDCNTAEIAAESARAAITKRGLDAGEITVACASPEAPTDFFQVKPTPVKMTSPAGQNGPNESPMACEPNVSWEQGELAF